MDAIRCEGVSKIYQRHSRGRKFQTLKSALLGRRAAPDLEPGGVLKALEPLDLVVPKGQSLGVVGGNGSGKSTLMKLVYGTTKPTTGIVTTHGRVSALIELGAGFHPEISGRENVVINGIMLGLSRKEIARRFDDIVEFAELADFIDAPVKTYSSGMYARLGFAVAISVKPDVLLVDEVLSVGDESFSHKCVERFQAFKAEGRTLVMVTHDLAMVEKLCDRALWLKGGRLEDDGEPRRVIDAYRLDVAQQEEARLGEAHRRSNVMIEAGTTDETPAADGDDVDRGSHQRRWGSREVEIAAVTLCGADGSPRHVFASGEMLRVAMRVVPREPVADFVFGVGLFGEDGVNVYGTNTQIERYRPEMLDAPADVEFTFETLQLTEGTYHVDVAVHREDGTPYDYHSRLYSFRVTSDVKDIGLYRPPHGWSFGAGVRMTVTPPSAIRG